MMKKAIFGAVLVAAAMMIAGCVENYVRATGTATSMQRDAARSNSLLDARRNLSMKIAQTLRVTETEVLQKVAVSDFAAEEFTIYFNQVVEKVSNAVVENLNSASDPLFKRTGMVFEYRTELEMSISGVPAQMSALAQAEKGDEIAKKVKQLAEKKIAENESEFYKK